VVHDRIAHQNDLEDVLPLDPGTHRETPHCIVEGRADYSGQLGRSAFVHHGVGDAAHHVLAKTDLGVHLAVCGQDLPGRQVAEVPGDGRRPDIEGDPQRSISKPRPDGGDFGAVVDGDGHRRLAIDKGALQVWQRPRVDPDPGEAPLLLECGEDPVMVAGGLTQLRGGDLDVVETHHRIDLNVRHLRPFPDDLAVDSALRRDVDDDVADNTHLTAQPVALSEWPCSPVVRLDLVRCGDACLVEGDTLRGAEPYLAAPADAAAATDRVEVDRQGAGGIEDIDPSGEVALPTRGSEQDANALRLAHVFVLRPVRRRPPSPPSVGSR
jgi:hypothetical protein